jgi:hypothetical protein
MIKMRDIDGAAFTGSRNGTSLWALTCMLALCGGCSGAGANDGEHVGSRSSDLRYVDPTTGQVSSNPTYPWCDEILGECDFNPAAPAGGADITSTSAPAVCGGGTGGVASSPSRLVLFSVQSSTNVYRVMEFNSSSYDPGEFTASWGSYGARAFVSKPACTLRESQPNGQPGFVVAGKSLDSSIGKYRIYASAGNFSVPQPSGPVNPTAAEAFTAVGSDTYTNGGSPALATGTTSGAQGVALVAMGDDNRTVYGYFRVLFYQANSWSARITGPVLPSGWTAAGSPSIDFVTGSFNLFHIVVRATSSGISRLFETYFNPHNGSPYFSNAAGSPSPSWAQLSITDTISSDPSLTYSQNLGAETLVYLSGTQLKQTSGLCNVQELGTKPILALPTSGLSFSSAPASLADPGLERNSADVVFARHGSQLSYLESNWAYLLTE